MLCHRVVRCAIGTAQVVDRGATALQAVHTLSAVMGAALEQSEVDASNKVSRQELTRGEIGILRSNRIAWAHALDAEWEWALVLEDDAKFVGIPSFGGILTPYTHTALALLHPFRLPVASARPFALPLRLCLAQPLPPYPYPATLRLSHAGSELESFLRQLPAIVEAAAHAEPQWQLIVSVGSLAAQFTLSLMPCSRIICVSYHIVPSRLISLDPSAIGPPGFDAQMWICDASHWPICPATQPTTHHHLSEGTYAYQ